MQVGYLLLLFTALGSVGDVIGGGDIGQARMTDGTRLLDRAKGAGTTVCWFVPSDEYIRPVGAILQAYAKNVDTLYTDWQSYTEYRCGQLRVQGDYTIQATLSSSQDYSDALNITRVCGYSNNKHIYVIAMCKKSEEIHTIMEQTDRGITAVEDGVEIPFQIIDVASETPAKTAGVKEIDYLLATVAEEDNHGEVTRKFRLPYSMRAIINEYTSTNYRAIRHGTYTIKTLPHERYPCDIGDIGDMTRGHMLGSQLGGSGTTLNCGLEGKQFNAITKAAIEAEVRSNNATIVFQTGLTLADYEGIPYWYQFLYGFTYGDKTKICLMTNPVTGTGKSECTVSTGAMSTVHVAFTKILVVKDKIFAYIKRHMPSTFADIYAALASVTKRFMTLGVWGYAKDFWNKLTEAVSSVKLAITNKISKATGLINDVVDDYTKVVGAISETHHQAMVQGLKAWFEGKDNHVVFIGDTEIINKFIGIVVYRFKNRATISFDYSKNLIKGTGKIIYAKPYNQDQVSKFKTQFGNVIEDEGRKIMAFVSFGGDRFPVDYINKFGLKTFRPIFLANEDMDNVTISDCTDDPCITRLFLKARITVGPKQSHISYDRLKFVMFPTSQKGRINCENAQKSEKITEENINYVEDIHCVLADYMTNSVAGRTVEIMCVLACVIGAIVFDTMTTQGLYGYLISILVIFLEFLKLCVGWIKGHSKEALNRLHRVLVRG